MLTSRLNRRTAGIATAVAVAAAVGLSASAAHAADPRLDEADAALQKAAALLESAQSGSSDARVQRRFEHHRQQALDAIARSRAHIAAAKSAVDNPQQK